MVPRILLSDDDPAFADAARQGLGRYGFDVTIADDGGSAIEIWDRARDDVPFHLCLVDFHMPRATGLDVVRHVRSADSGGGTPCVLMSAMLDEDIRRQAEMVRVYRVLDKPVRLKMLGDVVKDALSDAYGWAG